jgi:hypothetical protein
MEVANRQNVGDDVAGFVAVASRGKHRCISAPHMSTGPTKPAQSDRKLRRKRHITVRCSRQAAIAAGHKPVLVSIKREVALGGACS